MTRACSDEGADRSHWTRRRCGQALRGVGIGRRLAVVVSFPKPSRVLGIAPCRLTSSAQPLEHALASHSLSTISRCGGAQTARLAMSPTSPTRARGGWARRLGARRSAKPERLRPNEDGRKMLKAMERDLKARLALPHRARTPKCLSDGPHFDQPSRLRRARSYAPARLGGL
jgi:hypothetical protein